MSEQPEPKPAAVAPMKELTGRIGKYEIVRPLGKGAMGMVYLAHDTILERDVAIKVMMASIADDPELNQRFVREAKAVAKMHHPNVVNVFDLGNHTDGSPYIAMELLKGQDLQKAMRATPPMPLERKVAIIIQVLQGLAHAHQAGIVHRDIKPANIFLGDDGGVKIMDFGVARLTTASMTGTGNIVGTADYMSPEQVKGAKVDGRSDLFSVGCMLYELLAGRRPFHSENLMAIFYKITHDEPNWDLVPQGPEYDALLPIVRKALAKNLEERYQSAYEFAVELKEYLKTHATSATGQHALEGLLDLEPPPTQPPPAPTDTGEATVITAEEPGGATMDIGPTAARAQAATLGRSGTATRVAGAAPTVLQGARAAGAAPTMRPTQRGAAPTVVQPAPARPRPAPAPAPAPSGANPMLYVVLGGMGVALLGLGGYVYISQQKPPASLPPAPTTLAAAPPTTAPPPPTTVAAGPPPTAAPPPTFGEAKGRGAMAIKGAQSAFASGNYDRAIAEAQSALREDPGNVQAQRILDQALSGQKAETRFRAAESALAQKDYASAMNEAEAGRAAAPWDSRGPSLISRIREAQQRAEQQAQQAKAAQAAAQVNGLLSQADTALQQQKYDAAIALYDEVLKVDPTNQRATLGKTGAVSARALAQAAASGGGLRPGGGRSFVSGKTQAQSLETRTGGAVPEGFEDTAGVTVKKGTQASELPGKISFDIEPEFVKPGDKYTVKIFLLNEGNAPIQIQNMIVTTTVNGRKTSGPVPPVTKDVAPQQKAVLLSLPDFWKEDTTAWSMEVTVRTARGETYKNQVTWK